MENWTRILSVNVVGTMLCYKYAAQAMIRQGRGGRIVGASSLAGKQGMPPPLFLYGQLGNLTSARRNIAAYSASKSAIRGRFPVPMSHPFLPDNGVGLTQSAGTRLYDIPCTYKSDIT